MSNEELIKSLVTIVTFFNRTDRDKIFVKKAGINLEATSFQLFVTIGRMQPTNVSDLANVLGKSHSSTSRQIDKLEKLGYIKTKNDEIDARIRSISLSEHGKQVTEIINKTRLDNIERALSTWSEEDKKNLFNSLDHLADTLKNIE
ncbi:MarR family winged helix-turn-helix transcriptional regulator [Companilactobacillus nuruki]|uniref:MarR family transcriptional regulator n=1 Tax=Companilactobacillus nuruki TaxID=1993540 RepID=A0A2N7AXK9_9LACO|nr:MarR family winged helix-turn-helix transcriptional regulator [Companilactobacillus nuruki]PMD73824.1 MarR family transcriptional regulator [Companilactobacillus nuruki]